MDLHFNPENIDESAIALAIVGYLVVFFSLVMLFVVFQSLPKVLRNLPTRETLRRRKAKAAPKVSADPESGEVNAAIAAALYHYFNEMHDEEDLTLTIQKVSRNYSPWSSKIYSVRNAFNRR